MEWFLEKDGNAVRIPESVLIYKIENCEISPDTLIVNSEIKTWTPLKNTTLYTEYKKEFTPAKYSIKSAISHRRNFQEHPKSRAGDTGHLWLYRMVFGKADGKDISQR